METQATTLVTSLSPHPGQRVMAEDGEEDADVQWLSEQSSAVHLDSFLSAVSALQNFVLGVRCPGLDNMASLEGNTFHMVLLSSS
ncbi:hypothetical protein SKAU_G00249820 [Synaphobranchus kaupii]|uniref:Uncharacterized protein n=1 Tax=Synaphobranchus kaupii TaxID=118154 RepID=A0A9Q1IRS7_SYNKA|nr:hypothetical protein SKAU_G00249820 [Synaphobranchus kaupii]